MPLLKAPIFVTVVVGLVALAGCDKQPAKTTPTPAKSNTHVHDDGTAHADDHETVKPDTHAHEDGTIHADAPAATGHHGTPIELGSATTGGFSLRAARDEGAIKAGGDSPIDVWVTGGNAKVLGVRFWIGAEDAKGSMKAKAEIEIPAEPNHWHTHVEIPDPLPTGSKLWVEIEDDKGARTIASFDLKM